VAAGAAKEASDKISISTALNRKGCSSGALFCLFLSFYLPLLYLCLTIIALGGSSVYRDMRDVGFRIELASNEILSSSDYWIPLKTQPVRRLSTGTISPSLITL